MSRKTLPYPTLSELGLVHKLHNISLKWTLIDGNMAAFLSSPRDVTLSLLYYPASDKPKSLYLKQYTNVFLQYYSYPMFNKWYKFGTIIYLNNENGMGISAEPKWEPNVKNVRCTSLAKKSLYWPLWCLQHNYVKTWRCALVK